MFQKRAELPIELNKHQNNINNLRFKSVAISDAKIVTFKNCIIENFLIKSAEKIYFINCTIDNLQVSVSGAVELINSKLRNLSKTTYDYGYFKICIKESSVIEAIEMNYCGLNIITEDAPKKIKVLTLKNVTFSHNCSSVLTIEQTFCINCRFSNLSNINFGKFQIHPITSVLSNHWGNLSPKLTQLCMAYDAQNHPNPNKFNEWAKGGDCPYFNYTISRIIRFDEKRELWNSDLLTKPINTFDLIKKLFATKNITAKWKW